jgi:hypothetical protein
VTQGCSDFHRQIPVSFEDSVSPFAVSPSYVKHEGSYFDGYAKYARRMKTTGAIGISEICRDDQDSWLGHVGPSALFRPQNGIRVEFADETEPKQNS